MVDYQHEKCTQKGTSSRMISSPCVTRTLLFKNKPSEIRTTLVVHSKAHSKGPRPLHVPSIGDLVYLYSDRDKTKAHPRYIVVSKNDEWLYIKKFAGQQLRSHSYKVKTSECICVPTEVLTLPPKHQQHFVHEDDDQEEVATPQPRMPETNIFDNPHRDTYNPGSPSIPEVLSTPPCAIEVEQETAQDTCTEDDEEQVTSRPQRMRKPPPYLKDFVVS